MCRWERVGVGGRVVGGTSFVDILGGHTYQPFAGYLLGVSLRGRFDTYMTKEAVLGIQCWRDQLTIAVPAGH